MWVFQIRLQRGDLSFRAAETSGQIQAKIHGPHALVAPARTWHGTSCMEWAWSWEITGISWNQAGAAGHWDAEWSSYELLAPSSACISTAGSLNRQGNSPMELERVQILKPNHLSLNRVSYWLGDLKELLKSVSYSLASISIMDIMKTGWQWNYPQGW